MNSHVGGDGGQTAVNTAGSRLAVECPHRSSREDRHGGSAQLSIYT